MHNFIAAKKYLSIYKNLFRQNSFCQINFIFFNAKNIDLKINFYLFAIKNNIVVIINIIFAQKKFGGLAMRKAIGSKINLLDPNNYLACEFNNCVKELITNLDFLKLENFFQHIKTSRLQHSINVAYYSFLVCRFFGLDYKSAARAGLLHDFYLYDWRKEKQIEGRHSKAHAIIALRNAEKITHLNKIEKNAILRHMWPMVFIPPKYPEAIIVSLMEKFCATAEFITNLWQKARIIK